MQPIDYAIEIIKKLKSAGHIAYFAGGWVRDHLMKRPSSDIDIATDASPEKIIDLFPHTILVGLAFGVVIVSIKGHQFEVATFRKDLGYTDGRKPDKIEFSSPREDAIRRDFTINGMFYDPIEHVVHDFVHGAEDLQRGIIRAIGDAYERFLEDRLRMVRAVRFASRFNFTIDPETQEAIIANADLLFPAVAMERIWMELTKMVEGACFDQALVEMHRLGLLSVIFPLLDGLHLHEIKKRTAFFKFFPKNTPTSIYLCELIVGASREELVAIFQGLRVSNQELKCVEAWLQSKAFFVDDACFENVMWAHFYAREHTGLLLQVEEAKKGSLDKKAFRDGHEARQNALKLHIERIINRKPLVTATSLREQGISPGVGMGVLLKEAERLAVNQDIHDPFLVIQHLKHTPLWNN